MKTTILLIAQAHAAASDPAPATVDINDVATWLFLILMAGTLLWGWVRLWRWFDHDIRPLLVQLQRRSTPSTLRPWAPDQPITVAGARCEAGQTLVLELAGDGVTSVIHDLLDHTQAVVALHGPLALPHPPAPDFVREAQGRVYVSDEPPCPASIATLAALGRPAVVLTQQPPEDDSRDLVQKLGLVMVVIKSQPSGPATAVGSASTETRP